MNKLLRWIKIWLSQFHKVDNLKTDEANDGVIVIKVDAIGDFVIWLDSAKELREIYKDQKITLVCNGASVSIAKASGYFDEVIALNIRQFESDAKYTKQMLNQFKDLTYKTLIQTAYSRTVHMDILAAGIRASEKIGFVTDESRTNLSRYITFGFNKKKFDRVYDRLIATSDELVMEVKRNGELISALSGKEFKTSISYIKENEVAGGIVPSEDYFVIFPGASTIKKMWQPEKFSEVANYVMDKTGYTCLACGSKDEAHIYDEMNNDRIVNYFGKTSLIELCEVIRNAKLVISNDTSGIHFAAATRTPSVCILGEYNYGRFLPYECDLDVDLNMVVVHANMPCVRCAVGKMTNECNKCMATTGRYGCVDKITAKEVIDAVDSLLDKR